MAKNRKRKHNLIVQASPPPGAPPDEVPALPIVKFGEFKLTTNAGLTRPPSPPGDSGGDSDDDDGWERAGKRQKKSKPEKKKNIPEMVLSPQRLKSAVKVADLQNLVLWLVADGVAPQWLLVKEKPLIRRVVVLMVPGLTMDMFDGTLSLALPTHPNLEDEDMGTPISHPAPEEEDMGIPIPRTELGEDKEPNQNPSVPTPKSAPTPVTVPQASADAPPKPSDPDNFWPYGLNAQKLAPCLQEFPKMFKQAWPIKATGDDRHAKLASPISTFLNSLLPKGQATKNTSSKRIRIGSLLMTVEEMIEGDYPLHSSQRQLKQGNEQDEKEIQKRKNEGWLETNLSSGNGQDKNESGAVTEGKTIYAIDCEMCKTAEGLELTRVSVLNWDGEAVYDTLVKPTNPITDYVTQYSGMTAALLDPITTTLADVQTHLLTLFNNDAILLGQSLNSDLAALRLAHPYIVDTSLIYHHTRGPPYKPSLKWLTQKFLRRGIQNGGAKGHDSIEDAKACLDLLKLKLENGIEFGTVAATTESIFKRLERYPVTPKKGAVVDYGQPEKWYGTHAAHTIAATTDTEVVDGVISCATTRGMDFTWGRLRGLESLRGWAKSGPSDGAMDLDVGEPDMAILAAAVEEVARNIKKVHDGLNRNTALVVYSGTGDPRELKRLTDMQKEFRAQYQVRKWDELSVKWTDTEEQELRQAVKVARSGLGFLTVRS